MYSSLRFNNYRHFAILVSSIFLPTLNPSSYYYFFTVLFSIFKVKTYLNEIYES